jgi:FKBP-type peptidyl-prolyl cis-trans isomerase FklB
MKSIKFLALSALAVMAVTMASCSSASAPKATLRTSVDTTSYTWGVSLADQGLVQHLEQLGVLKSTMSVEQEFQMKMMVADSAQLVTLEKEKQAALAALDKENAPKLREFIKGMKSGMDIKAESSKSAYIQGVNIGMQLSQQMVPGMEQSIFGENSTETLNKNNILSGIIKVLNDQPTLIDRAEAGQIFETEMVRLQEKEAARQEEELRVQFEGAIAEGATFLAENAKREGVVTLPSGLQYEVIRQGTGATPTPNDRVTVHYHGTLIDGEVFDSSVSRGDPATFGVTQVISGWTEALQLMPVGSKWKLYIPYDLAYGSQDRGIIRPYSTLIFEVELLEIN